MKKLMIAVALMTGAFTFAASAEKYDSYAAMGTITTKDGTKLQPENDWLRTAIILGETGYQSYAPSCTFAYEGATIKATTDGVVHHASGGKYPHFFWALRA